MEVILLEFIKILVLQSSCSGRNIKVLNYINSALEQINIKDIKIINVDFNGFKYWDSKHTIIVTPVPVAQKIESQSLVCQGAYLGLVSQDEFNKLLKECIEKTYANV